MQGKFPMAGATIGRYGMPMGPRITSMLLVAALAIVTLAGCIPAGTSTVDPSRSPVAGASSPTPTPGVTEIVAPVPQVILVSSHSVTVTSADGATVADIPYSTDVASATSQISAILGSAPALSTIAATSCDPETTVYDWGGFQLLTPVPFADEFGAAFAAKATTSRAGSLEVKTVSNTYVGESLDDLQALAGIDIRNYDGGYATALLDPIVAGHSGVIVSAAAGSVSTIFSPSFFDRDYGTC